MTTKCVLIDQLPASRRESVWREAVCDAFVRLECRPDARAALHGSIKWARLGELHVAHVASSPQWVERTASAAAAAHEAFILVSMQISGRSEVQQADRRALLEPGMLTFYDTARPYRLTLPVNFQHVVLQVPRAALEARAATDLDRMALPLAACHPYAQALLALGPQLLQVAAGSSPGSELRAASVATELLALALGAVGEPRAATRDEVTALRSGAISEAVTWRARDVIARHAVDPSLSPSDVARRTGVSLRRLQEAFQATGETVTDAIWDMRLEFARQRLASPSLRRFEVSRIAADAGFASAAHFTRRFRARFGCTPTSYRDAAQNSPREARDRGGHG